MSKTKQPAKKAPTKSKAPASSKGKAPKASSKPVAKTRKEAPAPADVAVEAGVCPKGGDHEWKTEDGQTFCAKCFEPVAAPANVSTDPHAATVEQTTTEQSPVERPASGQAAGDQPATDQPTAEATGKKRKARKPSEPKADGKLSAIDAAAKVLAEAGKPMTTKEMIATMAEKGYWTSPGGKTPAATLYSAILREITVKGAEARFEKTERGKFAVRAVATSGNQSAAGH
jgi:hypothetical protein